MTPSTCHLASTLISHAAGLTSHAAAAELICAHHTWLTRDRLRRHLHPRRHQPRPVSLRLHRLGTGHHRPRQPPAQLLALRSRHPENRRQPRRPPHPRPPRPRPGLPRPHQHHPGHHGHHPRQRLTTTTRPPLRQPGHHQAPPARRRGLSRHPSCPPSTTPTCPPSATRNTLHRPASTRPSAASRREVPTVPHRRLNRARHTFMPDTAWPGPQAPARLIPGQDPGPGSDAIHTLSALQQWFTRVRLPGSHLTHHVRLFRSAHHPGSFTGAACGGFGPLPA